MKIEDHTSAVAPAPASSLQPIAYSIEQACAVSSLKRTTMFELIRLNRVSVTRIGRRTLVLASSLRELLGEAE